MRQACKTSCKLFENIDLFGYEAEVYFKGKSKKTSLLGKVLTYLYALVYFAFFVYKVVRMINKVDVNFYETTTFTGEIPSLYLDNEMFYGGFGLMDIRTGGTFVDPTIYTAKARFYHQTKIGNFMDGVYDDIELEVCDLNKFGKEYRDDFSSKNVEKLYCFKNMNYTIAGHSTLNIYNYFQIFFYPCHNTTENGNHCQDINLIRGLLTYTGLTVKIQDVELTPENYHQPTFPRVRELTAPVMQALYQNINAYFHIISIESDTDVLGFEALSKYDTKKAFKYDVTFIMTSTSSTTSLEDGDKYCDITIQLTEQIITIKRTYTKLLEALGDVGGLMEFIFSFFNILSSFLTETLYEKSLINSLFSFDLNKKLISIKKHDKIQKSDIVINNNILKPSISQIEKQETKKPDEIKIKNVFIPRVNKNNHNKRRKSNVTKLSNQLTSERNIKNSNYKRNFWHQNTSNLDILKYKLGNTRKFSEEKQNLENKENINYIQPNDNNGQNLNRETPLENLNNSNIDNIVINRIEYEWYQLWCCFLCLRKFKNVNNALIDEGMNLIVDELDIRNIFKNMIRLKKLEDKNDLNENINMSAECRNKLENININDK